MIAVADRRLMQQSHPFPQIVSGMTSRDPIRHVSLLCKLGEVEHANTCGSWRYEGSFPFCMLTSAFVIVS